MPQLGKTEDQLFLKLSWIVNIKKYEERLFIFGQLQRSWNKEEGSLNDYLKESKAFKNNAESQIRSSLWSILQYYFKKKPEQQKCNLIKFLRLNADLFKERRNKMEAIFDEIESAYQNNPKLDLSMIFTRPAEKSVK